MIKLSPSMMCADLLELGKCVEVIAEMGVNYIHLDFMDGKFVPNISFGFDTIKAIKKHVDKLKSDIHIMAYEPMQYFDKMDIGSGDFVSIHYEACSNVEETLLELRSRGAQPCLAINPGTSTEVIEEYLDLLEGILVMTIYPGFAGQPMAPGSLERIAEVRHILETKDRTDIAIQVDGNVSWENIPKMRSCGATFFVAGSSSVFNKSIDIKTGIIKFNDIISNGR